MCIYGALIKSIDACVGLTEQKNVLNGIVSDGRHIKSALETVKKDHTKQNKASEDMMTAMFFLVVIALAVLAVTLR